MNKINQISNQISTPLKKYPTLIPKNSLKNKTAIISGASRGIGLVIAKSLAKEGANIVILAKTTDPHPKLPGTIYTAAKEIEELGGKCLPLKCDIRHEDQIQKCVQQAVEKFGGIDIVVNNASAINMSDTKSLKMKSYDLMHQVNTRGTFLLTKICLPYLKKSQNGHILSLSPPLLMDKKWFSNHVAYSMAKYGMSMCILGWSEELKEFGISANALWPRTFIATAAVQYNFGGNESIRRSRKPEIIGDCVNYIFKTKGGEVTGNFFIDDSLLRSQGVKDFKKYQYDKNLNEDELIQDVCLNQLTLLIMPHYPDEIEYSEKYKDDYYEYRHVLLPKDVFKKMPKGRLLNEIEWRSLGVQQSRGWSHYDIHEPEPFILLFRRALNSDPNTGLPPSDWVAPEY